MRTTGTLTCVTLLAVLGCATAPTSPVAPTTASGGIAPAAHQVFNPERLNQIQAGRTTRANVLDLFGYPTARRVTSTGEETWVYRGTLGGGAGRGASVSGRTQYVPVQRTLVITFAQGQETVSRHRLYATGEQMPDPLRDQGPPFPVVPGTDTTAGPKTNFVTRTGQRRR